MNNEYTHTPVQSNFIYPEEATLSPAYKFGSGQIQALPLRPDGDWRKFLPPEEEQRRNGIESSACFVEAQQHAIATLEEHSLVEKDNNYAARFNALLASGTPQGGNPLKAAESIRKDGLVPDNAMPFNDQITSWEEYHSWKGVDEAAVRALGKADLARKERKYDVVYDRSDTLSERYAKLKEALKYSPCPISVTAWFEKDGLYYKPDGWRDNHLALAVHLDDKTNQITVWDTYSPYLKVLAPGYESEFAMRWSVTQKTAPTEPQIADVKSKWLAILELFRKLFPNIIPSTPTPMPEPTKVPTVNVINAFCMGIQRHEGGRPQDLNMRLNNPGACRFHRGGYLKIYGNVTEHLTGTEKPGQPGFAKFPTYEQGFLYLKNLVRIKAQKHPAWDLYQFFGDPVEGWAPDSDNNNSRAYAKAVAAYMGVDVNTFRLSRLIA